MSLDQAIEFINQGNIVAMYTSKVCRAFANGNNNLTDRQVTYIDVSVMPGLLDKGEWDYYFETEFRELVEIGMEHPLREYIVNIKSTKKKFYSLG